MTEVILISSIQSLRIQFSYLKNCGLNFEGPIEINIHPTGMVVIIQTLDKKPHILTLGSISGLVLYSKVLSLNQKLRWLSIFEELRFCNGIAELSRKNSGLFFSYLDPYGRPRREKVD